MQNINSTAADVGALTGPSAQQLRHKPASRDAIPSAGEALALLHQFQVHQVELEMQVEALKQGQEALKKQADRLRMLALELAYSEQSERRQTAQVLHENIMQCLAGATFQLEALGKGIGPEIRQQCSQVLEALRAGMQSCQSLASELCPLVLYDAGLTGAIQYLAEWMRQNYGVVVQVKAAVEYHLADPTVRFILYGAVRELLLNVIQHAGVKEAEVRLSVTRNNQIQIVVKDRGQRFDPDHLEHRHGHGRGGSLFKVREQLGLLGGQFKIQSALGMGSQITLLVAQSHNGPIPALLSPN